MGFNRILKAFGNLDQILEGVKNKIFKKEDVEHIANVRWMECLKCPALDETGKECAVKGTQPCCSDCGCALGFKLRALASSCPRKRWNAVTDNQGEAAIKNQIKKDEENASNI